MEKFKKICVFCGSNSGNRKIFSESALDLGRELVERKIDLVYGGGSIGLMGLVSQAVYDGGCNVLGIIPRALVPVEISGHAVGEVLIVSDMHERKAEMAHRADAFVALPGGYGTMEELLEVITWSQLGIHEKPVKAFDFFNKSRCCCLDLVKAIQLVFLEVPGISRRAYYLPLARVGLLNIDGYYDCLLGLFDKGVEEGFIKPSARNIVISATTAKELLEKMEDYAPIHNQVAPSRCWNTSGGPV